MLTSISHPDELVHDVGRLIVGQIVTHDFVIDNTSSEPISILSDTDIRLNCGCSALVPAARRVKPGARTTVQATVNTKGRMSGRFNHGGSIVWTSPSGATRRVTVALKGEVAQPFQCEPEVLTFEGSDVRAGTALEVVLRANLAVDWRSLNIASPHTASVRVTSVTTHGQTARFHVRCVAREGVESLDTTLTISARVAESSPLLSGSQVSVSLPIRAKQQADLMVTPQTVPITFNGTARHGTARLLLRGDLLAQGKSVIRSITCDGFRVQWKMSEPTKSKVAIVEMNFEEEDTEAAAPELRIEVQGKSFVRLSVTKVRLPPDKR